MTTDLSFLADRGWTVRSYQNARDKSWTVSLDRDPCSLVEPALDVMHRDLAVAERMATVAALVADGHDLIRLLYDVYTVLPDGELRSRVLGCLLATHPAAEAEAA